MNPEALMAVSYVQPQSITRTVGGLATDTTDWPQELQPRQHVAAEAYSKLFQPTSITVAASTHQPKQEDPVMARLIRYTVVDHDPILVEEKPDACILLEGRQMLNGTDEKGFLMDLAPVVAEKLTAHNTLRQTVEYEDEEGRSKTLKAIRLGQLDVVVEVLREYK